MDAGYLSEPPPAGKEAASAFAGCFSPSQKSRESKVKARVKTRLLQHLRRSVTCITVDAAADEILSSELIRASVWTESQEKLTPNLRFGVRQAHASRRITSRLWVKRIFVEYAEATDTLLRRAVRNFRAAASF